MKHKLKIKNKFSSNKCKWSGYEHTKCDRSQNDFNGYTNELCVCVCVLQISPGNNKSREDDPVFTV